MVYLLLHLLFDSQQRLLTQYRYEQGKVIRDRTIEKDTFYPSPSGAPAPAVL